MNTASDIAAVIGAVPALAALIVIWIALSDG
jgi:hypothetical protein